MAEFFKTRMVTAEDEPLLSCLFAEEKAREFAPLGWSRDQLRPLLEMQYRARQLGYAQGYPAAVDTILCLEDGTPVGRRLAERQPDCYRIVDIAVLPEYRNRGIATWALRQMQHAAALELLPVRLNVGRTNPAQRLYERLGFISVTGDELSLEMEWQARSSADNRLRVREPIALDDGAEVSREEVLDRIFTFLCGIGLNVQLGAASSTSFLPGIQMVRGGLRVDVDALLYPGDLLHEAGHLAVMTPERRAAEFPQSSEPAEEMAAIAWSYAAALHIGIPPEIVFHEHGYRGQACALLQGFREGRQTGVPILAWIGLTTAERPGEPSMFPRMLHWLRADGAPQPEAEAAMAAAQ